MPVVRGRRTSCCRLRRVFQSWTPLGLDLIFKKAVRTNHPQSTYDDTHERRNSRHIESGDKKQSEWKCNHIRSPHRARHNIASGVCIASCGASACISKRNIEWGESGNDLHRSQCVDNPCRCLPQKRLTLDGSISCLLYTSPSPRDQRGSRMPSSA